jgi:hypothetical protein
LSTPKFLPKCPLSCAADLEPPPTHQKKFKRKCLSVCNKTDLFFSSATNKIVSVARIEELLCDSVRG